MIRAPRFRYHVARSVGDAAMALASSESARLLAGGTDLLPSMKRRQETPELLVSLRRIDSLRGIESNGETTIGAGTSIAEVLRSEFVRDHHRALFRAVSQIASPLIRNTATLGGNLCLDTRCNYYNQTHEWRKAIGFCLKRDGDTCWVAPSSPRCWAVASSDAAPALIALRARITLRSDRSERDLALEDLYADDGAHPLAKRNEEILTEIRVPLRNVRSTYWKLRRRGSIDFPVLGVAAAIQFGPRGTVEDARIVLGVVASTPLLVPESQSLHGSHLTDDAIEEFAETASRHAKPLDNTDFGMTWRKGMVRQYVAGALRELRDHHLAP
jgi:4-hydroxybenzoyl-CoA reductase subunit beta